MHAVELLKMQFDSTFRANYFNFFSYLLEKLHTFEKYLVLPEPGVNFFLEISMNFSDVKLIDQNLSSSF